MKLYIPLFTYISTSRQDRNAEFKLNKETFVTEDGIGFGDLVNLGYFCGLFCEDKTFLNRK